ncbi:MAG: ABC transporter permease subunit [Gemmatimonadota bacterium]
MSGSVEWTVARVTWRLLLGQRRWILALVASLLPVLVAWLFVTQGGESNPVQQANFFVGLMAMLVLTALLPLAGLVHGTAAFGTELDDGTLRYILAKPVARWRLVAAKLATAALATVVTVLPGVVVAAVIIFGTPDNWLLRGFAAAVLVGSVLYAAIFLVLSLLTRRALLIGLLYVIAWEGALSRAFSGMRSLSVREYAMAIAEAAAGAPVGGPLQAGLESGTVVWLAVGMLTLATAGAIARLRVLEVAEEV